MSVSRWRCIYELNSNIIKILRFWMFFENMHCISFPKKSPISNGVNDLEIYICYCMRSGIRHESTHLLQNVYIEDFNLKFYFRLPDISKIKIRSESVTEINRKCEMMFAVISKWNSSRDNVPERIIWRWSEVKWPIIRLFSLLKQDWTLNSGKWWFNLKGWILENLSF